MKQLRQGERHTIEHTINKLDIKVSWNAPSPFDIDASAFLVDKNDKVLNESDLIFYNNPCSSDKSVVRLNPLTEREEQFSVELKQIQEKTEKISFVMTIHEGKERQQTFRFVTSIQLEIRNADTGVILYSFPLQHSFTDETALVLFELYRYKGEWKINAVGRGFFNGLADICKGYGLTVEESQPIEQPTYNDPSYFLTEIEQILYENMVLRNKRIRLYIPDTSVEEANSILSYTFQKIEEKDHYLERSLLSWNGHISHVNGRNICDIKVQYRTTKEQEELVDQKIWEIIQYIPYHLSPYEKTKWIHDFIIDYVDYDESLTEYTAYAALVKHKTVCQGYAMLAYRLLNALGIETIIIKGEARDRRGETNESHAWNMVKLHGDWYHLDCTWDDPVGSNRVHYDYFLITDAVISRTHTWNYYNYPSARSDRSYLR